MSEYVAQYGFYLNNCFPFFKRWGGIVRILGELSYVDVRTKDTHVFV